MKWFACDPLIGKPRLPADLPADLSAVVPTLREVGTKGEVPITSTVGGLVLRSEGLLRRVASASGGKRIGTQAGESLSSRADLLSEMRRLGIQKAMVRHVATLECGPFAGNLTLVKETRRQTQLLPVWFLTPDGTEPDFSPDSAVEAMLKGGAALAAVMYADIPDAAREAIAHGNLDRLLKEVKT